MGVRVACCVLGVFVLLSASLCLSVRTEPPRACSGATKGIQSMRLCFHAGPQLDGWEQMLSCRHAWMS